MAIQYEYSWNWAYRIDHWVRVLAIVVLTLTGAYIHWPFGSWPMHSVMAWMRFGHFVAGYIFVLGLAVRVYLAFNSRFDRDWRDFGLWRNLRNVPDIVAYYLFLKPQHRHYRRYNPLQALTYLFWAFLIGVQALTGYALYRGQVFGFVPAPDSFRWVIDVCGGVAYTRLVHHLAMWVFILTALVHVYMAAMTAWTKRDHSFRAMFSGYQVRREG